MVNSQELFKRRGDGGPDELFWEESDTIFTDLKTELMENYKNVSSILFLLNWFLSILLEFFI